jgi:hypothetical protein
MLSFFLVPQKFLLSSKKRERVLGNNQRRKEGIDSESLLMKNHFDLLTQHDRTISALSEAWPQGVEILRTQMLKHLNKTLVELGWGKGIGDRQFRNWLKMIAPSIPPKKKMLGSIAYRELLYLGYWMSEGGGVAAYLAERDRTNRLRGGKPNEHRN